MSEQPEQLPEVKQVLVSTVISLVNLGALRLTEEEHKNVQQAKEAIDAARALVPLCPEQEIGPVKEALSQLQMLYVKEQQAATQPAEPDPSDAAERAKARSKIWTPPGS